MYLYVNVFLSLFLFYFTPFQISNIRYIVYIILFIIALFNNQGKISFKYLFIVLSTIFLMFINLLSVDYKDYVFTEILTISLLNLVPLYVISTRQVDYEFFLKSWFKFSIFFSVLSVVYMYLYFEAHLGYWHIADLTTLNIIILFYEYFLRGNKRGYIFICLILNAFLSLFFGSRAAFVGIIFSCIVVYLIFNEETGLYTILRGAFIAILFLFIAINLVDILIFIQNVLLEFDIRSRNINLFILQLQSDTLEVVLSGRDLIYEPVMEFIRDKGIRPGGLATTRFITRGSFYHSHNVFLDLLSVFGTIGFVFVVCFYLFSSFKLIYNNKINSSKAKIFIILTILFWSASLVDAYFLNNIFFITSIAILFFSTSTDN